MDDLITLFFQDTLRHWHFEALVQESGLSRERVHHYLHQLIQQKLIRRVKPRKKMPYYLANREHPSFRMKKRLFGLQLLESSGLFAQLQTTPAIKTAILFGSFARGDWGRSSDVDLFLYGDDRDFDRARCERQLKRELQVFSFAQAGEIKLNPALLQNIAKGFNIKGSLEPLEVVIHAQ